MIRSEWIKLRSLRSTWIGLAAVLVVLIGIGVIAAAVAKDRARANVLPTVLSGADLGVLLIGILGVLAGAREYGSRMITVTMAAVPRRGHVVLAKSVVLAGIMFTTAAIGVLGAFGIGSAVLSGGGHATVALSDDHVVRSLVGMAAYLTAISLLGLSLGLLLRSAAGGIGALVAGILLGPGLAAALLPSGFDYMLQFLPSAAAAGFTTVSHEGNQVLSATSGAVVLALWVLAALGLAVGVITQRDV